MYDLVDSFFAVLSETTTCLEFIGDHVTQTLVVDDAHKYVCLHFSAIHATVEPLRAVVVVAHCYTRKDLGIKWYCVLKWVNGRFLIVCLAEKTRDLNALTYITICDGMSSARNLFMFCTNLAHV